MFLTSFLAGILNSTDLVTSIQPPFLSQLVSVAMKILLILIAILAFTESTAPLKDAGLYGAKTLRYVNTVTPTFTASSHPLPQVKFSEW